MKNVLLQAAMKLNKSRKRRKSWQKVVQTMIMVVVFCTTYALILPAITMQAEPVCGMEDHTHTEECYTLQTVTEFTCDAGPDGIWIHQHGELCWDASENLICLLPEIREHSHTEDCFTQTQTLNCPLTHVHSEACQTEQQVLSCGMEEIPAHIHDETCTGTVTVQTCTLEEHEHGEGCFEEQTYVCEIPESEEHTHSESCTGTRTVQICTLEAHAHGEGCYEEQTLVCEIPEGEGHAHSESCYTMQLVFCDQPTAEDHAHEEGCYQTEKSLTCGLEEIQAHTHGDTCRDAEGNLICTLPEILVHTHTEECLQTREETVLTCTIPEHTHEDACYPLEEETPETGLEFRCGFAKHTHEDACHDAEGQLICTIPEHTHEAACVVEDLDLTADMEWPSIWEAQMEQLEFTGVWAEDLLTVAESQLGYAESKRNCILKDDRLLGYTRYSDWYGNYYADWDDMFVSFCLHYAGIPEETLPWESDTAKWIQILTVREQYVPSGDYTPVPGDLIFWDSDEDGAADKSGIVSESGNRIRVIAGDTKNNKVETLTFTDADTGTITGFCPLPANTMNQEQWQAVEAVNALLAQLPDAQTLQQTLQQLNEDGDKAGYEALRQEAVSRMEEAEAAYNALDDAQKALVTGLERLEALKEVCGGESWQQFAPLTDDGAVLTQLTALEPEIIPAPTAETVPEEAETTAETAEEETGEAREAPAIPENVVRSGDTVLYPFTGAAESWYSDVRYGEARVKLELVLPLTEDKAAFDLEAMAWLEEARLTTDTRILNDTEVICRVLTGYKTIAADETTGIAIPGSFTETAVVTVRDMAPDQQLYLILSAALEHSTWDGVCQIHQVEEKLTVHTRAFSLCTSVSEAQQQRNYEAFLLQIEELGQKGLSAGDQYEAGIQLLQQIAEVYKAGGLTQEQYEDLAARIESQNAGYLRDIAEPGNNAAWLAMDFDPSYYYGEEQVKLSSFAHSTPVIQVSAMPETAAAVLNTEQIDREGGELVSDDNAVYVSKTIAATDVENVFDITLNIITRDEVEEIYKDPNMAVVVVMDVSNTMKEKFNSGGGTTRYQAAISAGSNFLKTFAEQESNLSRVGFVAFNTHAHEIFDLSPCGNMTQANALIQEMSTDTKKIMDAYGSGDKNRFTNMEAGLKMARDMLADAPNAHKYIIFITDGFPTTYVSSGYTGYNPYNTTSANDGNTRGTYGKNMFYDKVFNKYITYGTSYSDTAAIKARQMASALKNDNINIFSIGVDVSGQTLSFYNRHSYYGSGFSVVERMKSLDYYNSTGYEIGLKHSDLWDPVSVPPESSSDYDPADYPQWEAYKPQEAQYFKNWLKGSATNKNQGIGSGYYYDSNDADALDKAYEEIFAKIVELNANSSYLDWVATDPMPDFGVHEVESMEFIAFYDAEGNLAEKVVLPEGMEREGNINYNTADFHEDTMTIHWDLKNSGYQSVKYDNTTMYQCTLSYRVRLKNEEDAFVEGTVYDTNDTTTLTYRTIEVQGSTTTISEQKSIDFPIPAVHGYLSELNFKKVNPVGEPLANAEFLLRHDSSCSVCRGDGETAVSIPDMTAKSDHTGMISFARIPSGHTYILTETAAPNGFIKTENQYKVVISYDRQTVTVLDKDGKELEQLWNYDDPTIENDMYYALPETGGMGTSYLTFGGMAMIAICLVYICITGRKRQKGGR